MPIAGYTCLVRKSGVSTGIVTEPLSLSPTAQSTQFRITDAAKRVIDPNVDFHFKNGTATIAYTTITALDLLNGYVTFAAAQSAGSATSLSFSGSYLPMTTASDLFLDSRSFKLSLSRDLLDTTVFTGDSSNFTHKRISARADATLDVESIANVEQLGAFTNTAFQGGTHIVTEIFFGGVNSASIPRFRGITKIGDINIESSGDDLVKSNVTFKMAAAETIPVGFAATYGFVIQP